MNRTTEILEYLAQPDTPNELVLAPNAPPVSRSAGHLTVAINTVFDAQDLNDTLATFRTRALLASPDAVMSKSGAFSFGIRDLGRFRINYATQRGSRVMRIIMLPAEIPELKSLCEDSNIAEKAMAMLRTGRPGLIAVSGPSAINNAIFVYALLQQLNHEANKVIYIIEPNLTLLVKHENSIVIQCELHADVATIADGVRGASRFEPDVLFVGDIKLNDDLPEISRAIENGTLAIVSSVMIHEQELVKRYCSPPQYEDAQLDFVMGSFVVTPGTIGKLAVTFHNMVAETA